jgi:hypothetical protein
MADTTLEWLDAAADAESGVMHIGAIGEVPHFIRWPPNQTSASKAVIGAREEPGSGNASTQLEQYSRHWLVLTA